MTNPKSEIQPKNPKSTIPDPPRLDGHPWDSWDIARLVAMVYRGQPFPDIGASLERTPTACRKRLQDLLADPQLADCPEGARLMAEELRRRRDQDHRTAMAAAHRKGPAADPGLSAPRLSAEFRGGLADIRDELAELQEQMDPEAFRAIASDLEAIRKAFIVTLALNVITCPESAALTLKHIPHGLRAAVTGVAYAIQRNKAEYIAAGKNDTENAE